MKPRNKFIVGTVAAVLTFGTLSATVGRHYSHHCGQHEQQGDCHRGSDHHDCNQDTNQTDQQH